VGLSAGTILYGRAARSWRDGKEVNTLRPLAGTILRLLHRGDEDGQTLVEYALLLALIALVVFIAVFVLGDVVAGFFTDFGNTMDDVTP